MTRFFLRSEQAGSLALLLVAPMAVQAKDEAAHAAIRKCMQDSWSPPGVPLDIAPIVVLGDKAVAGWLQGTLGGRALLSRNALGHWQVTVCGGDELRNARALEQVGMPAESARQLARGVAMAEADLAPQRLAIFSRFGGMVNMGASSQMMSYGDIH